MGRAGRRIVAGASALALIALAVALLSPEPARKAAASVPERVVAAARTRMTTWIAPTPARRTKPAVALADGPDYYPRGPDMNPEAFEYFVGRHADTVVCRLDHAGVRADGYIDVDADTRLWMFSSADRIGIYPVQRAYHDVVAKIDGYHDIVLSIDPVSGCSPSPLPLVADDATVHGFVANSDGVPWGQAAVYGCGDQAWLADDGTYRMAVQPGDCVLYAGRLDGIVTALSEPEYVTLAAGQDLEVDFVLPGDRVAATGVVGVSRDDGLHLVGVDPNSPAADAGLKPGDVIVGIDGQDVAGMTWQDFASWEVGDAGTDVKLDVLSEDDSASEPWTVTLQRDYIEFDDGRR